MNVFRRRWAALTTEPERGDVPGWVMITLMTAGLVVAIWALAGTALREVFERAIETILGG